MEVRFILLPHITGQVRSSERSGGLESSQHGAELKLKWSLFSPNPVFLPEGPRFWGSLQVLGILEKTPAFGAFSNH